MCRESKITVLFDDPYWVAIIERVENCQLEAARIVFGPEPKDYEVYEYILSHYRTLSFSPPVETDKVESKRNTNPKRVQRQIRNQMASASIGTKAQQALKAQQEENKKERKIKSKEQREAAERRKFELKQKKKKEKHKGR